MNLPVNPTLAQMEAALARVVGPRGVTAMLERSRQRCGDNAAQAAALTPALQGLCTELLGAALADRVLQASGEHRV
jgi:DNA-binding FrmR family transcriptional regulator